VLYRFYDTKGALLYVGITADLKQRFRGHAAVQPWWHEVAACRVEFLPDREALVVAERDAIYREQPRYNQRGRVWAPLPVAAPDHVAKGDWSRWEDEMLLVAVRKGENRRARREALWS